MAIPKMMSAAVVEKFREQLVLRELPVPTPGPGQALVEIMAIGVCHTDLHAADGDWPVKPNLPITPGHEGAGIVGARVGCYTFKGSRPGRIGAQASQGAFRKSE